MADRVAGPRHSVLSNEEIAGALERVADLLEVQGASSHRVRAWRRGAESVRNSDRSPAMLVSSAALGEIAGIGPRLAVAIEELAGTGRLGILERLEGTVSPEERFSSVAGIGPVLAGRVHDQLGLTTLEELEQAAHDGRLDRVPGFGSRRTRAVQEVLGFLLSASSRRRARILGAETEPRAVRPPVPEVALLLAVDDHYRREGAAGHLREIAPRRFNPSRADWLPILHLERGGWSFTALYSNTARAHALGRTHDWVVIFYERDGVERQCTVVTELSGPLKGRRVVRGREEECRQHYTPAKEGLGVVLIPKAVTTARDPP